MVPQMGVQLLDFWIGRVRTAPCWAVPDRAGPDAAALSALLANSGSKRLCTAAHTDLPTLYYLMSVFIVSGPMSLEPAHVRRGERGKECE